MNFPHKILLILYLISTSIFPLEISSQEKFSNFSANPVTSKEEEDSLDENNYIIGPGDVFEVDFANFSITNKENNFIQEFKVIKTGKAYIPLIGEVVLEGLTYSEAYKLIKKEFSKELIAPEFTLNLIKARPITISVVGEVTSPGIYTLGQKSPLENEATENNRIVNGLLKAGGLTKDSNIKEIELVRKLPKSEGGGFKKANLDLYELVFNGNHSQNPILFDGDFIKVSKIDNSQKIPETNFTNTLIEVHVVGEVLRPGKIQIKNGTQLTQAVYFAGGPRDLRANLSKVQLVRTYPNGSISVDKYNLKLKGKNPKLKNPMLENGDIVRVSPNTLSKTSDIIRETTAPVLNIFALYKIFD